MKNNILKKVAYLIILIILILTTTMGVYAVNSSDLNSINNEIDKKNTEIHDIHSQMTKAMSEVSTLTSQISEYESQIIEMETKIEDLNLQIGEKQKNIEEQQVKYDEQQQLLNKRLVAMYQSGSTSYLDMLLSSSSLTDFISKYYLIEELAEYDTELLEKIQALKTQIETEKKDLETAKKDIESTKYSIELNKKSIEDLAKQKQTKVASLSAEEKKLQNELDDFEDDKKQIEKELAAIAAQNRRNSSSSGGSTVNYSVVSNPSTSGYICPIAGRSKSDITCGFYGYSNHNGVDFARNSKGAVQGVPVLAAKSGVVVTSMAKIRGGSYYSYGEYIVIDHQDGTMTLYAHMQPGSRTVNKGDYVSQGQQIGNVGMTGNATGYHLHFEVRVNGRSVNPTQYLP